MNWGGKLKEKKEREKKIRTYVSMKIVVQVMLILTMNIRAALVTLQPDQTGTKYDLYMRKSNRK